MAKSQFMIGEEEERKFVVGYEYIIIIIEKTWMNYKCLLNVNYRYLN